MTSKTKNGVTKMTADSTAFNTPVIGGVLLSLLLSACGGGGSGSQDPDPVLVDLPIAYVKRPLPVDIDDDDNDGDVDEIVANDIFEPNAFNPGAALFIRPRASGAAPETNITDRAWMPGDLYDVKDVESSFDGTKLIFAMRAPDDPDLDDDEQAKWDIWEYELPTDILRRIISGEAAAQEANDIAPHYLPDGRIVFSSDRQHVAKAILLDDGKTRYTALHEDNADDEYGYNLHVMEDDGTNIDQITFNQSHDLHPSVMRDGRILFLRWDHYANDRLSLYTVDPYGRDQQFLYGFHSQDTGPDSTGANTVQAAFAQPREMPDGRILVNLRQRVSNRLGGDMALIDAANYTEIDRPTAANLGATNPGQVSASLLNVYIDGVAPSPHGLFNGAYPFFDNTNRLLVSWNQCRLVDPQDPDPVNPSTFVPCTDQYLNDPNTPPIEAEPLYGLWIYNPVDGTQLPVVLPQQDLMYTDVVAMESRTAPTFIPQGIIGVDIDQDLLDEAVGVVHIRSVYDLDGTDSSAAGIDATRDPNNAAFDSRAARFLRIVKAVSLPDNDVYDFDTDAFGFAADQRMKEIIGYVPIEPDGSVMFKVPANIAFSFSILNANTTRVMPRHQNWLQVRAGEVLQCNGCHSRTSELPHGRRNAEFASINTGSDMPTIPFPNTNPALYTEMGETMAETYARINGIRQPSVNVVYTDEWSVPPANSANDINLLYSDLTSTRPASNGCIANWSALCRVIINYETHIQPLWEIPRVDDNDASAVCIDCHSRVNPVDQMPQVPAAQLELTSGPSVTNLSDNPNDLRVKSYQDLFVSDVALTLTGGALAILQVPGPPDEDGNPTLVDVRTAAPIPNGRFAQVFGPGGSHDGGETRLTPAELKLISEWLDIGAQYFNNPFDAPEN
jgi:hypothetical protein